MRFWLAALAGVVAELCAVGLMATAAWLIATAAQQPPIAVLGVAIVAVRGFAIFRGVFRYMERLTGHDVALRAVADLRARVYAASLRGTRDALARMVSDVDSVQDLLLRCALPASVATVVSGASITLGAILLPSAGMVLAAGLVVAGVVIPLLAGFAARRLGARLATARDELVESSVDLVDGAWELAAFGATGRAVERGAGAVSRLSTVERRSAAVSVICAAAGEIVQGLTVVAVILCALRAGADQVLVAVLGLTALAAFAVVLPLSDAAQRFVELRPAVRRVREMLATPPRPDRPRPLVPDRIVLRGVRVAHALAGIDLTIGRGRSVAVIGPSGAGKSTLLEVIAGLIEPDAGVVALPEARGLMQDAHLFHTSIRANLVLAKPTATESELRAAARTAAVLDWVEELPDGWETVVGEGGKSCSGGQRLRLMLARALLADPPVLLLDEPTEGLDPDLADAVLTNVLASRAGRTTVVVTHRLSCLDRFNEVIELDRGRIVRCYPTLEMASSTVS
jgi:ATP-binding cassette, subfamily C, bacterial CydC